MKNFLLICFSLLAFTAKAEIGPVNRSNNMKIDGTLEVFEKRYINVKNGSGGALSAGAAVVWDLTADDGATVTTSATAGVSIACIMAVSCASSAICKCQTYGYATALYEDAGVHAVAGQQLFPSTVSAGVISARSSYAASEKSAGVFLDATVTGTGSVEVMIQGL